MRTVVSRLPEWIKRPLRPLRNRVVALPYHEEGRFCPVCRKSFSRFRKYRLREDAQCPYCQARERHRLLWLYLTTSTDLFDGTPKKVIHIAPELCFVSRLRKCLGDGYLTVDLYARHAMEKMDITNIEYPDHSFDVILCSHVLEHVQDDKRAMREFFRVLKNSGWAILLVPITADKTFESSTILDSQERMEAFGQEDHVRMYGPDFVDRLRETGFRVEVKTVNDIVRSDEAKTMGLTSASGDIFYCTKRVSA